jgi:hypothetical protein
MLNAKYLKKSLIYTLTIFFSYLAIAQIPELIPLDLIVKQIEGAPSGDSSKILYLIQRCSALNLAISTLIKESDPDLSNQYIASASEFGKKAAISKNMLLE